MGIENIEDQTETREFLHFLKENKIEAGISEIDHKQNAKENFRHRFLHTIGVCSCFFALGWRIALLGPTLPDLRMIIDTDLSTIAWIFTSKSIGGLVGSVCGGIAYDRLNNTMKTGVFMCVVALMGVFTGIVPWCHQLVTMMFAHAVLGVTAAALNTAGNADISALWREKKGEFMQMIHGSFSIGAIISPIVCEPFLTDSIPQIDLNSTGWDARSIRAHGNMNHSNATTARSELEENVLNESQVYIPYIISACVCFMVALYFIMSLFTLGDVYTYVLAHADPKKIVNSLQYSLSGRMKNVFTILLATSISIYSVSEFCVTGFLVTFLITELCWSLTKASNAMSLFWLAFAFGRITGIFVVRWFRLSAVLVLFLSICTGGIVLLWAAVVFKIHTLVWICIVLIGYGLSVIMPSIYTWLSDNVRALTGQVSGLLFVFISVGNMTIPLLVGNLMDKVSQMWFIYAVFILFIVNLTLYIFILTLFTIMNQNAVSTTKVVRMNA